MLERHPPNDHLTFTPTGDISLLFTRQHKQASVEVTSQGHHTSVEELEVVEEMMEGWKMDHGFIMDG